VLHGKKDGQAASLCDEGKTENRNGADEADPKTTLDSAYCLHNTPVSLAVLIEKATPGTHLPQCL
jgi:hypothetical protein